jgi:hypothetical protein
MKGPRLAWTAGCLLLGGLTCLAVPATSAGRTDKALPENGELRPGPDHRPPWRAMNVRLDVLVDGRPVPLIHHGGRTYLPVPRMGAEYQLRVSNDGSRRVTAIVSVDGLSVITQRPASEHSPGYIVDPRGSIVIPGWKRDSGTAGAFTFVSREDSHAARKGHPENVGVIGLVAFEELAPVPRPILREESGRFGRAVPRPLHAPSAVGNTGTGSGRDVDFRTYQVPFVRSTNKRTVTIYYDTPEALRRAGVSVPPVPTDWPAPFPAER